MPAEVGMRLDEVDTPALILDLDAFETNLKRLADAVRGRVRVRAHAKTHKCPDIGRRQIAAGAVGVCCQKVSEAEAMVEGGIGDVLISNEIVGARKLERLAALAKRARIGVCVDHGDNVRDLQAAALRAGATVETYIELEVGMRRCGVAPGGPALALAQEIVASPNLRFAGIHAYHGRAQHIRSRGASRGDQNALACKEHESPAQEERHRLPIVTGPAAARSCSRWLGAWDEINRSYVFMDGLRAQ
jgi:D-serine deaminase-like pyridoxal phosphate-dependent protein